jgi:hypothetical protein
LSCSAIGLPAEDGEGSRADLAFLFDVSAVSFCCFSREQT